MGLVGIEPASPHQQLAAIVEDARERKENAVIAAQVDRQLVACPGRACGHGNVDARPAPGVRGGEELIGGYTTGTREGELLLADVDETYPTCTALPRVHHV